MTINHFLGVENELQERICSLETIIEEHEKQKKRLLHDFDNFKGECADHETKLKLKSDQQIALLSKDLQQYQLEFETKASAFESLIKAFEKDKEDTIIDLTNTHQYELANLIKTQQSQLGNRELQLTTELEALRVKYSSDLENAETAYSDLKNIKDTMESDYEEKFKKSKTLYEKEIELLKQNQTDANSEKQNALESKLEKLTKDFQFQEAQYRHRINGLLEDLSTSEDTINKLKADITSLSADGASSSSQRDSLLTQVSRCRNCFKNTKNGRLKFAISLGCFSTYLLFSSDY